MALAAVQLDAVDHGRLDRIQGGGRTCVQLFDQDAIGNVVAEGLKTEFGRSELDVGRPKEAAAIVDDADGLERRGMWQERLPDAERFQHVDRADEQGRRSRVQKPWAIGPRGRTNQGDFGAGMGKSERRGKTRRSGADDGDVTFNRFCQACVP